MIRMSREGARCPISGELIDENAARVNGAIVLTLLLVSALTPAKWLLAYLAADFGIKVFAGFAYSPNCHVARIIANALDLPRIMSDSAPKRFAATVGFLMSTAALVAFYFGGPVLFMGIVAVFGVCAGLESLAGFCVGCFLFGLLPDGSARIFVRRIPKEACDG